MMKTSDYNTFKPTGNPPYLYQQRQAHPSCRLGCEAETDEFEELLGELKREWSKRKIVGNEESMSQSRDIHPAKYSDIVSSLSNVLWDEHQEPKYDGFVYSCVVNRDGGERLFVGKRLFKDRDEAKEDLAHDVVKVMFTDYLV
jgi:hypothetical protein